MNCLNPMANPSVTTTYTLESSKKACKTTSMVTVEVDNTCGELFAPTAFSPNEDNNNDTWCIYGNCIETIECEIFNRWGQKVFTITGVTQCWDGKLNGALQNAGVFVYQAKIGLKNGENKSIKGNFTLVR
jgi:gliding motility-associated-like protein